MVRKPKDYDNEILNLRAFYLRVLSKLHIVILGAILCAVIFGAVYEVNYQVKTRNAKYEVESTLYIYFAYDENSGTLVDHYNAYTWNTIIKTDEIIEPIVSDMAALGYDMSREEIEGSLSADIPSDVRLMILTVSGKDKETAKDLSEVTNNSMVAFGRSNTAFEQIKVLSCSEPSLDLGTDRLLTAVIFGAVCGLILTILILLLISAMDDEVYISEDAEKRYHIPVLGMVTSSDKEEPPFLRNEMINAMGSIVQNLGSVAVFSADDTEGIKNAKEGAERIQTVLGNSFNFEITKLIPMELPGNDEKCSEQLATIQGAIILMDMGKKNGAMTEHLISMLHKMECPIVGIVITNTDSKFIKRYLGL